FFSVMPVRGWSRRVKATSEFGVLTEPIAVAPDVDDVTVMHEAVDERRGHDLVAENLAPLLEALVRRQDRRGRFVAAAEELKEEHRPRPRDRQVADFVDHHQTREDKGAEAMCQPARALRVFERVEEIGQRREVDAPAALRRRDGETEREMRFPDARWSEQ